MPPRGRPLDECLDEQGHGVAARQSFDAGHVLRVRRSDELDALQLLVVPLEVRLVLVDDEHLRVRFCPCEWASSVTGPG